MYVKTRDQINADLANTASGSGDSAVVLAQQMLRNFVFTLNWIQEGKDADRYAINAKVKADLDKLISAPLVKKFQEALQATKSGVEAILEGVPQAKATAVLQYVKENEKALVLDVLDKKVKELDQESEERKEEKQPRREPKEPRADGYKGGDRVYEERKQQVPSEKRDNRDGNNAKDMFSSVRTRYSRVRFEKDNFAKYAETQEELDQLLFQFTDEIKAIKQDLKKKFKRSQNSSGNSKNYGDRREPRRE